MALKVDIELRRVFELATLRREAKSIETPQQWHEAAQLQMRCNDARSREKDNYAARYDSRVEMACRRLIDKAAQNKSELKPLWAADDRFNPDVMLRQAQREVRESHRQRIERIDEFEHRQLKVIVERSRRMNELRGVASEAFERASDRRSGIERRRPRYH